MIRYRNNTNLQNGWLEFDSIEDYIEFYAADYITSNYVRPGGLFSEELEGISFKPQTEIDEYINQTISDQLQDYDIDYDDWSLETNQGIKTLNVFGDDDYRQAEKTISDYINSKEFNIGFFEWSVIKK